MEISEMTPMQKLLKEEGSDAYRASLSRVKSVEDLIGAAGLGIDPEVKANENVDPTTNANWFNTYGVAAKVKDLASKEGDLLSRLSEGFEGSELPTTYPLPYDITQYFMKGKTVWRDSAQPTVDAKAMSDVKSDIVQTQFILQFNINDEMIQHSTDSGIFNHVVKKAKDSAMNTIENVMVNGDSATGASGNVNSDDQAPATTFADGADDSSLQIDDGLRKVAIDNANTVDIGAFDSDEMNDLRKLLPARYKNKKNDLLFLFEPDTYLTAEQDDSFKLATNTRNATIDGGSMRPFGIEAISHDLVPLTEADGKASGATPANNVKGQIVLVYKPAVRWGYGKKFLLEVERVPGYGFTVTVSMEFSFVIMDPANTVALGINVTV
jgi:hypothetical protein